jgi:hypothetical protein
MALIACPACGTPVSEQAEACPKCGHPVALEQQRLQTQRAVLAEATERSRLQTVLAAFVALLGAAMSAFAFLRDSIGSVELSVGIAGAAFLAIGVLWFLHAQFGMMSRARPI